MREFLNIATLFIVMLLLQVMIFNHIIILHVAVPLVFIYFIIRLRIDFNSSLLLTLSFLLGLLVDISADTLGVDALACTLLAMLKRPVFYAYIPRDDKTKLSVPSIASLGMGDYFKYLLTMTSLYCFLAFAIEYFSVDSIKEVLIGSAASTVLTTPLLLGIDSLMDTRSKRH